MQTAMNTKSDEGVWGEAFDLSHMERMGEAIRLIASDAEVATDLNRLAARLELSPQHFQRLFTRHIGVSPKRFRSALILDRSKRLLAADDSVLDAALEAGTSGPGRLHDLFITHEAMTPGEFKAGGQGLLLRYGIAPSPFGLLFAVFAPRGLAGLAFADARAPKGAAPRPSAAAGADLWSLDAAEADMRARFPGAAFTRDDAPAAELARLLFDRYHPKARQPLNLVLLGTNFQVRIWRALLEIPAGETTTYTALADRAGLAHATRAAASAVGRNPISLIIPCHRVIRVDGGLGGYHWGLSRKRAMLAFERAATTAPPTN